MSKRILGWREWVGLPDLGIAAIRVKVDTGARSSALHVDSFDIITDNDRQWVRFEMDTGAGRNQAMVEILDRRKVTDSGGHSTERIFIRTGLVIADQTWPIEINLSHRKNMLFPMLLGRTAIAGRYCVDPNKSFVLGGNGEQP